MINLYAYYSIGGYKDLFLGELKPDSSPTYYLPLLSFMKQKNKEEEREKIAILEKLPKIERIDSCNSYGFPQECSVLFSHGGYILLYKTLNDGRSCLALRDLARYTQNEEGRGTPFCLLFVSDNEQDINTLDNVALFCLNNVSLLDNILSPTIVYDSSVNGIRADLSVIYDWIVSCPTTPPLLHTRGQYNFIMVGSPMMAKVFLNEQKIATYRVDALYTVDGRILNGFIRYPQIGEVHLTTDPEFNDIEAYNNGQQINPQSNLEEIINDVELSPQTNESDETEDVSENLNIIEELKHLISEPISTLFTKVKHLFK